MTATEYYAQLLSWSWDRQRAQELTRHWFSRDHALAAFKAVD